MNSIYNLYEFGTSATSCAYSITLTCQQFSTHAIAMETMPTSHKNLYLLIKKRMGVLYRRHFPFSLGANLEKLQIIFEPNK